MGHLQEGKAHRYVPLVERQAAGQSAVARLLETIFRGSPELLLTQLVSDRSLSDEELQRLRKIVDSRIIRKEFKLVDTVSDNASYGAFTLGPWDRKLVSADLRTLARRLELVNEAG